VREVSGKAPIPFADGVWQVPPCVEATCRLRYRVHLGEAARSLDDFELALDHRGALLAPPSSWLLRPLGARGAFQLTVATPPGTAFLTGLTRDPRGVYTGDVGALDDTPFAAFGPLTRTSLSLPGGALEVGLTPGRTSAAEKAALHGWIERAARAVSGYFGRFPMERAALIVRLEEGAGVGDGHTMGNGGGAIVITAGEHSRPSDLDDDRVLVHELVHLSFPDVRRPWAEEGLATYLAPVIRARAGMSPADEVWHSFLEGLPEGLPQPGEGGLDETDTWARRYWGGALFWLRADVEIRRRTAGKKSLADALRAVLGAGGNIAARWELDRALAAGDAGAGVPVLRALRAEVGRAPARFDLPAFFRDLGVALVAGKVVYDEAAPLAAHRRALTAP
jgi:predicted metalloprotease with PDZ domain